MNGWDKCINSVTDKESLLHFMKMLINDYRKNPQDWEHDSIDDTRPYEFHGVSVPEVLISGHHENINKWRHERSVELTMERRPDLYSEYERRVNDEKEKPKRTGR